jgi:XTP/dITP diphosphohydrolase
MPRRPLPRRCAGARNAFFHARVAAGRLAADGGLTIDDVADTLTAKLVRRHPHVFGSVTATSAADVNANWEEIKKAERAAQAAMSASSGSSGGLAAGERAVPSVLDGVPFGQPAPSLAAQLQRRAERAGIAVPAAPAGAGAPELTGERAGDALMALVARVREAGLDPELELRGGPSLRRLGARAGPVGRLGSGIRDTAKSHSRRLK